jgi:hypothetical protein
MSLKRTIAFPFFLGYLGYASAAPTRHHEDTQPSIDIISANKVTSRIPHAHIPICYMHYYYDCGTFAPSFCKGTLMCAQISAQNPLQVPFTIDTLTGCVVFAFASSAVKIPKLLENILK